MGRHSIRGMVLLCAMLVATVCGQRWAHAENPTVAKVEPVHGLGCDCRQDAEARSRQWRVLIKGLTRVPDGQKVVEVNRFFNTLPYSDDRIAWDSEDYWCTPQEFLARGTGDCEDYALAKYCTLVASGIEDNQLFLSCVLLLPQRKRHMVLCYAPSPGADPLVLDNTTALLLPLSARRDLLPVYSFNRGGAFLPRQNNQRGLALGSRTSLSKWQDFLSKVESSQLSPAVNMGLVAALAEDGGQGARRR